MADFRAAAPQAPETQRLLNHITIKALSEAKGAAPTATISVVSGRANEVATIGALAGQRLKDLGVHYHEFSCPSRPTFDSPASKIPKRGRGDRRLQGLKNFDRNGARREGR